MTKDNTATERAAFKIKIKVPRTLEEAAKLRKGLEREMHKTPQPAKRLQSNIIHAIKATADLADLLRPAKPATLAYLIGRYAGALTTPTGM